MVAKTTQCTASLTFNQHLGAKQALMNIRKSITSETRGQNVHSQTQITPTLPHNSGDNCGLVMGNSCDKP